jgi:hypothetical protein
MNYLILGALLLAALSNLMFFPNPINVVAYSIILIIFGIVLRRVFDNEE